MKTVLEFKNFSFKYIENNKRTLKNINIKIKEGEKVLITGPSGCGKSTLGRCINGIIPFLKVGGIKGEFLINGISPYEKGIYDISKSIGTILQDQDGQFVGITVEEDIAFWEENKSTPIEKMKECIRGVLKRVGMKKFRKQNPNYLSGGQKQAVSLAGILKSEAEILFFDEPIASLDPKNSKRAVNLMSKIYSETKKTIIVIEHRIEEILELEFDRIIVMSRGRVVANSNPKYLFSRDIFSSFGLREPLYIEALRFAGIDLNKAPFYPLENAKIKGNIKKIQNWCKKIEIKENDYITEILKIRNLSFSYDKINPILKNISFNLYKNEILAILGNNGAGKTTLTKIITGFLTEDDGNIRLNGKSLKGENIRSRGKEIGYIMQNPNHMLFKDTVYKEIEFGLKIQKIKDRERIIDEVLKICDLQRVKHSSIGTLSYGQKKRLTIAAILALKPKVIILDEPTAGQDLKRYKMFMEFLRKIANTGIGIVIVTHNMHLTLEYADRAIVFNDGEIVGDGTPIEILSNKEIVKKSNLRETSLLKLANIAEVDPSHLMDTFLKYRREIDAR